MGLCIFVRALGGIKKGNGAAEEDEEKVAEDEGEGRSKKTRNKRGGGCYTNTRVPPNGVVGGTAGGPVPVSSRTHLSELLLKPSQSKQTRPKTAQRDILAPFSLYFGTSSAHFS